ncbi:MAG: thiamine-phosphate kinase [Vampirovibrio sp.]|nr:thiamine-phosphate kinase [Vampirovibrio sp.]
MNEQSILSLVKNHLVDPSVIADDAYVDPDTKTVYTTDLLVEGQHFDRQYFQPEDIGWKAAAVNISDVTAMGGKPQYILVSLGLPKDIGPTWIKKFYNGLSAACQKIGVQIIGGDTVRAPQVIVNVAATGLIPTGHTVGRRNLAEPGDWIIATGHHGLSAVGLNTLRNKVDGYNSCKEAHLRPTPRVKAGARLSKIFSRLCMMDSSDGLADALLKMADASSVRMEVVAPYVPVHWEVEKYATENNVDPLDLVFYGGEDFELVATVSTVAGLPKGMFTVIGRVKEKVGQAGSAILVDQAREKIASLSLDKTFQHFQPTPSKETETSWISLGAENIGTETPQQTGYDT